jgi:formylglycine-generating enzyme required for sulfatase activity
MRVLAAVPVLVLLSCAFAGEGSPVPAPAPRRLLPLGINAQGAEEWLRVKDGAVVVRVPRGLYLRRPYEPSGARSEPRRTDVESCFIDKFEVTNARFARFLADAAPRDAAALAKLVRMDVAGLACDGGVWTAAPGLEEFPVTAATGHGAMAYAAWVGGRIPTPPEWEKAAGGPEARTWPWGEEPPDEARVNFARPSLRGPERVGSHPSGASYYGCFDMAGNVYDRVLVQRGERVAPEMIKGGSWATPHPLNLRVADLCMQSQEVAERTVGFRCAMDDDEPERPTRVAAPAPTLRLAKDFAGAIDEAKRRRVPLFLSLQFDTCGQCDRTRAELFRDPRFVAYCNENVVVVVGHDPGDAFDDPHPTGEGGACPLYPGLTCEEHRRCYVEGLAVVGTFVVSPGNFVLHPDRVKVGARDASLLVRERELPKWGDAVDAYLAAFESARKAMAEAATVPATPEPAGK